MASFKLIVPPGVRVINRDALGHGGRRQPRRRVCDDRARGNSTPVIRLTGFAFMADVNVVVRRREEPIYDDEDDRPGLQCRRSGTAIRRHGFTD